MIIKEITVAEQIYAFTHGAYVMSYVTQTELVVRTIRLETADGSVGWGEIVRKPSVDRGIAQKRENEVLAALPGQPLSDIFSLTRQLAVEGYAIRGCTFALETAAYDLLARRADVPLYTLLGGKAVESAADYFSFSDGDVTSLEREAPDDLTNWPVVQVKLGSGTLDSDRARIEKALDLLNADQLILLDFNGALDVTTALNLSRSYDDPRIVWEEPCNTVADNIAVAAESGQRIMFDQCLTSLDEIARVVADGRAYALCVKPALLGTLDAARVARDLCINAGIKMRIDGPWCGHIATAASLHLAAGAPANLLIAGCDLRQPLRLDEDWGGTRHLAEHRIAPEDAPGHGAAPPLWTGVSVTPNAAPG